MSLRIGICKKCGREVVRRDPATVALCCCSNPPQEVQLKPIGVRLVRLNKDVVITRRQKKMEIPTES